jgi:hypothetical protein
VLDWQVGFHTADRTAGRSQATTRNPQQAPAVNSRFSLSLSLPRTVHELEREQALRPLHHDVRRHALVDLVPLVHRQPRRLARPAHPQSPPPQVSHEWVTTCVVGFGGALVGRALDALARPATSPRVRTRRKRNNQTADIALTSTAWRRPTASRSRERGLAPRRWRHRRPRPRRPRQRRGRAHRA